MSRARWGAFVLLTAGLSAEAQPVPADPRWERISPSLRAAYGGALADRFVSCLVAEGHAAPEADRAVVRASVAPLVVPLLRQLDDIACSPEEDARRACLSALEALSCATLSRRLASVSQSESPSTPPPAWAEGFARGLSDRVARCYAEERGSPSMTLSDAEALTALRLRAARAVAARATRAGCRIEENAVPACGASLRTLPCATLTARAAGSLEGLVAELTPACTAMLVCPPAAPSGAQR